MDRVCSFYIPPEVKHLIPIPHPPLPEEQTVKCHWCFSRFNKYDCKYIRYGIGRRIITYICPECQKGYKGNKKLQPVMYDYIAGE